MEEVEESPSAPAESSPAPTQNQSDTDKRPSSNEDRKKWEAAELPVLPVAQQTLEETCATASRELSLTRDELRGLQYVLFCFFCGVPCPDKQREVSQLAANFIKRLGSFLKAPIWT